MLPKKLNKTYSDFYDSARYNEILEPKTTLMIHLAAAMAVGCYPWMESYFGVAKEQDITNEEIGAVQSIVMAVSAGRVRAQFREARINSKKAKKPQRWIWHCNCTVICDRSKYGRRIHRSTFTQWIAGIAHNVLTSLCEIWYRLYLLLLMFLMS